MAMLIMAVYLVHAVLLLLSDVGSTAMQSNDITPL